MLDSFGMINVNMLLDKKRALSVFIERGPVIRLGSERPAPQVLGRYFWRNIVYCKGMSLF